MNSDFFFFSFYTGVAQHSRIYITNDNKFWRLKSQYVEAVFLPIIHSPRAVKCASECSRFLFNPVECSLVIFYNSYFQFSFLQPEQLSYKRADKAAAADLQDRQVTTESCWFVGQQLHARQNPFTVPSRPPQHWEDPEGEDHGVAASSPNPLEPLLHQYPETVPAQTGAERWAGHGWGASPWAAEPAGRPQGETWSGSACKYIPWSEPPSDDVSVLFWQCQREESTVNYNWQAFFFFFF